MNFTKEELATIEKIVMNANITIKGKDAHIIVSILKKLTERGDADGTTDA